MKTEYRVPYAADGVYKVPDHVGDTVKIVRKAEGKTGYSADNLLVDKKSKMC
jgi:hypothetical protein